MRKFLKILRNILFIFIGLLFIAVILINTSSIQNLLIQKTVGYLSKKLETHVEVKHVRIHFFNKLNIEGLLIEDQQADTFLYAGTAQVRIKDLLFGGDQKKIYYVGLENAKVFLTRTKNSDKWNYEFLEKVFSKEKKPKENKSKSNIEIELEKFRLKDFDLQSRDEWVGLNYEVKLAKVSLDAKGIDVDKKNIALKKLNADKITVGVTDYPGGRPPRPADYVPYPLDTTPFNPNNWKVTLDKATISNGSFYLEYPNAAAPLPGYFDYEHIVISKINSEIKQVRIEGDSIFGNVFQMTASERSGLIIRKLSGDVKVSPVISEIKNLYLETNNSVLKDYYAMHYSRFPDFIDYIDKVRMEGNVNDSKIAIRDIEYFAPELKRFNYMTFKLNGKGYGSVDHLEGFNMVLEDKYTKLRGDFKMQGLPEIYETFIEFNDIELQSNGEAAIYYAPELKDQSSVNLNAVTQLDFKGNYSGFIRDFTTKGEIITNFGKLNADLNMQLPEGENAQYSGNLEADNFDVKDLFNQKWVGELTFALNIDGEGLSPQTLNTKATGKISKLNFYDYDYHQIDVNGLFSQQKFEGIANFKDPNANFDFNGEIDFSKEKPFYHFDADARHINFKPLNLSKEDIRLSAGMHIEMEGRNLDDFTGSAHLTGIDLKRENEKLNLNKIDLTSEITDNDEHYIRLSGNNFDADLTGYFRPSELLSAGQMFFSYYTPEFFSTPEEISRSKNVHINIKTGDISDLTTLINPDLKLKDSAQVTANFDLASQSMTLNGHLYGLSFGKIESKNTSINGIGNYSGLKIKLDAKEMYFGQNQVLTDLKLNSLVFRDTANFEIETISPASIEQARLNGSVYAHQDSLHFKLKPSQFNFKKDVWVIESGNALTLAPKYLSINNLNVHSGEQNIKVNVGKSSLKNNNALIKVSGLNLLSLNNFVDFFGNEISGRLDGEIKALNLLNNPQFDFDLVGKNMKLAKEPLGALHFKGNFKNKNKTLSLTKGTKLQNGRSLISYHGDILLEKADSAVISGLLNLDRAHLSIISPFMYGYVSELDGQATGQLSLNGSVKALKAKGDVQILDAAFIPDITGVKYFIPKANVTVNEKDILLDTALVKDKNNFTGKAYGKVSYKGLYKFDFNINATSDNVSALDKVKNNEDLFYGKVNAKVNMTIRGLWEDLTMSVTATPLPSSQLFLLTDYSGDIGTYNYINFKKNIEEEEEVIEVVKKDKFNFILDAIINPNLETTLFLDQDIGDKLWAKGNGNLILEIPSVGEMKMNGTYIITEGDYNFSFQQMQVINYQKRFIIDPNSTIKWNGPILDAELDVKGRTPIKARLYDLIADEAERLNLSTQEIYDAQLRQTIEVIMSMKGMLSQPDMSFKMHLAEGRSVGTYAYQKLERINSDDKQALIQVTSLLLLGQFVPPEGINTATISSGTINNMSELFSSLASSQLTNFANKVLGMQDLSVGVKYKNYSMVDANQLNALNYLNRNELGVNFKKNFFNDRLILEGGGIYDWGKGGSEGNYTANLAGDFKIQYLITQDGRVRFSIFRTSDYDPLYSLKTIGRQGVNLNYRKSFDGLKDIFADNRKTLPSNAPASRGNERDLYYDPIIQKLYREAMREDSPPEDTTPN